MDKAAEERLGTLAKRLLATPHKPREESKVGKPKVKMAMSPAKRTIGKGRARVGKKRG